MVLEDKVSLSGYFSVQLYNSKNEIVDQYEDKNLVMLLARNIMAKMISGQTDVRKICKLNLGVSGYSTSLLTPLTYGQTFGSTTEVFDENRTTIISEALGQHNFNVTFTPPATNGDATGIASLNTTTLETETEELLVGVSLNASTITYSFDIPASLGNGNPGEIEPYTEAGLYFNEGSGYSLFSMKTFPVKAKDDSVRMKITWKINF
jgi:hypothetical protein